jgi:hypothetical protein
MHSRASLDILENTHSRCFQKSNNAGMYSAQPNYYTIYGTLTTKPVTYTVKHCTSYTPYSF